MILFRVSNTIFVNINSHSIDNHWQNQISDSDKKIELFGHLEISKDKQKREEKKNPERISRAKQKQVTDF